MQEAEHVSEEEIRLEMFIKDCRLIYTDFQFLKQKRSTYVVTELVFGLLGWPVRSIGPSQEQEASLALQGQQPEAATPAPDHAPLLKFDLTSIP